MHARTAVAARARMAALVPLPAPRPEVSESAAAPLSGAKRLDYIDPERLEREVDDWRRPDQPVGWPQGERIHYSERHVYGDQSSPAVAAAERLRARMEGHTPNPKVVISKLDLLHPASLGTRNGGRGVFCRSKIKAGESVGVYSGAVRGERTAADGRSKYIMQIPAGPEALSAMQRLEHAAAAESDGGYETVIVDAACYGSQMRFINSFQGIAEQPSCEFFYFLSAPTQPRSRGRSVVGGHGEACNNGCPRSQSPACRRRLSVKVSRAHPRLLLQVMVGVRAVRDIHPGEELVRSRPSRTVRPPPPRCGLGRVVMAAVRAAC